MKRYLVAVATIVMASVLGVSGRAFAERCPDGSLHAGKDKPVAECNIPDAPAGTSDDLMKTVQTIINVILGIVGLVAVVMLIMGGISFVTSQGDAGKVAKARNTILYGVVGLVIALLAFAIVNFVLQSVFTSTSS